MHEKQATCRPVKSPCQSEITSNAPHPLGRLDQMATLLPFHRNQEIYAEGQRADYVYRVIAGAARTCVLHPDGRRQIVDLLLPRDFFGLISHEHYEFTAEAVAEGTTVARYDRRRIELMAQSDPELARELRLVALQTLSRIQMQLLIMGRITALEKVSSFVLAMAARISSDSSNKVVLPVSRYDIADYLAVSVETVSRSLTNLRQRGLIALSGTRTVRIVDRDALEDGEPLSHEPYPSPRVAL
jgi:CRP/FNR family nitrogen fixation transcriptional regulator